MRQDDKNFIEGMILAQDVWGLVIYCVSEKTRIIKAEGVIRKDSCAWEAYHRAFIKELTVEEILSS